MESPGDDPMTSQRDVGDTTPQPPRAADEFLQALSNEVNHGDVAKMVDIQQHVLMRFEKTNEMLQNFNVLSASRYETVQRDFQRHTALLLDTKRELDDAFSRIRSLKAKLSAQHPKAFRAAVSVGGVLREESEVTPATPPLSRSQRPLSEPVNTTEYETENTSNSSTIRHSSHEAIVQESD